MTRALALVLLFAAGTAYATVESELVKAGVAAYEDLEYAKAVQLLQDALKESLTREEKIVTYKTLAFSHVALDEPAAAQHDFENLLHTDESFELDRRISPRIRAAFDQAKTAIASGKSKAPAARLHMRGLVPTIDPARPTEGQALNLLVLYPGGVAESADLYFRTRGRSTFSRIAVKGEHGRFSATIPGLQIRPPGLEYYLVLLDDNGGSVAAAGALARPLDVDVRRRPVYKRGWFWGVVGGVAAAAIIGGVLGATVGSSPGKNAPATVTVVPQ
jgi:hypothetical protein